MRSNRWTAPTLSLAALATALALGAPPAAAQAPDEGDALLEACTEAVQAKREKEAKEAAARAETLFEARIAAAPRDPAARVGLARVLSQCRIPYASFMGKGMLVGRSNELLTEALELDPTHWGARFALAMNHYHTPAFLGRTGDAVRHLETLLEQQGERNDRPRLAEPYLLLGDLYLRTKRVGDARAVWTRGMRLFPSDARFAERLTKTEVREPGIAGSASARADARRSAAVTTAGTSPDSPGRAATVAGAAAEDAGRAEAGTEARPADEATYRLDPVLVTTGRRRADEAKEGAVLRPLQVMTTPGGTADLMQVLQTQPGTTRVTDGSDLYVRGGDPAESPVLVDGARLAYAGAFESLHGGLFGLLDPAVLEEAYFSSGAFSARYGNALSGVLSVRTLDRPAAATLEVAANMVGGAVVGQAPLGPRAGVWGSVRGTETSLLLALRGGDRRFTSAPRSLEVAGGVVTEPAPGMELRALVLAQADGSTREVEFADHVGSFTSRGATRLGALAGRWARGRALVRGALSATERSSGMRFGVLDQERTDRSADARLEGELALPGGGALRGGAEAAALRLVREGRLPTRGDLGAGAPSERVDEREEAEHLGGYLEAETRPLDRLVVTAGLRADRLPGEEGWTADPRLALGTSIGDWTVRLGGGMFHQGRWRVRYRLPDGGAPAGTPRRARHLVVGVERGGALPVRVEGYWKRYDRYVEAADAAEDAPRVVTGDAAGVDAIVRLPEGAGVNGWITYSLLRGEVELEGGERVPSATDVTHSLTTVGKLPLGSFWELGATARYASGRPYTPITGATGEGAPIHGAPHAERLPSYTRLDSRLTRFVPLPSGLMVIYLEVLNVLGEPNVMGYTYRSAYRERIPVDSFFSERTAVLGASVRF